MWNQNVEKGEIEWESGGERELQCGRERERVIRERGKVGE